MKPLVLTGVILSFAFILGVIIYFIVKTVQSTAEQQSMKRQSLVTQNDSYDSNGLDTIYGNWLYYKLADFQPIGMSQDKVNNRTTLAPVIDDVKVDVDLPTQPPDGYVVTFMGQEIPLDDYNLIRQAQKDPRNHSIKVGTVNIRRILPPRKDCPKEWMTVEQYDALPTKCIEVITEPPVTYLPSTYDPTSTPGPESIYGPIQLISTEVSTSSPIVKMQTLGGELSGTKFFFGDGFRSSLPIVGCKNVMCPYSMLKFPPSNGSVECQETSTQRIVLPRSLVSQVEKTGELFSNGKEEVPKFFPQSCGYCNNLQRIGCKWTPLKKVNKDTDTIAVDCMTDEYREYNFKTQQSTIDKWVVTCPKSVTPEHQINENQKMKQRLMEPYSILYREGELSKYTFTQNISGNDSSIMINLTNLNNVKKEKWKKDVCSIMCPNKHVQDLLRSKGFIDTNEECDKPYFKTCKEFGCTPDPMCGAVPELIEYEGPDVNYDQYLKTWTSE